MRPFLLLVILLLAGAAAATGYFESEHRRATEAAAAAATGGDPRRGRDQITNYGCTACHDIPGFRGTRAHVGPPLDAIGLRMYIAGAVENNPDNLVAFLRNPRSVVPRGAMPNLNITENDARDLAAYLYTLQ